MTTETALSKVEGLTREQVDLIKHTVAVGATDNELKLFLYQANKRGLDPLTRQIYFIKRKQYNPDTEKYEEIGTIQTGIDGFRVVADRTGKLSGIKRGTIKDDKGTLVGAWAEIYRTDWTQPAREEVSFKEYCQTKKDGSPMRLWASMPETMIKKVAEAAALRMAFPEDLSGIYTHDEMQQADTEVLDIKPSSEPKPLPQLAESRESPTEQVAGEVIPESEEKPKALTAVDKLAKAVKDKLEQDETPITAEQLKHLTELMEKADMSYTDLGIFMNKDKKWGVKNTKEIRNWQYEIIAEAFKRNEK